MLDHMGLAGFSLDHEQVLEGDFLRRVFGDFDHLDGLLVIGLAERLVVRGDRRGFREIERDGKCSGHGKDGATILFRRRGQRE
jgi:hypothetical protein